ncbi:MAG: hypothetical protein C6W56_09145 [Caldibacillus debilis]|nr:MAG: hypothetical protein C6W56_09145 [Caldibacillus debilis]
MPGKIYISCPVLSARVFLHGREERQPFPAREKTNACWDIKLPAGGNAWFEALLRSRPDRRFRRRSFSGSCRFKPMKAMMKKSFHPHRPMGRRVLRPIDLVQFVRKHSSR